MMVSMSLSCIRVSGLAGQSEIHISCIRGVRGNLVSLCSRENACVWQVNDPRFDILPISHDGYHDLRVATDLCLKWDGQNYVDYEDSDYHHLSPGFFNSDDWQEAELFWAVRYKGLNEIKDVEPQWFPAPALLRKEAQRQHKETTVDDPKHRIVWVSVFKGSVWGVAGNRAFLLLPRPAYKGSEHMEFDGDWLVIHGESQIDGSSGPIVARYNRRTHELKIEQSHPSLRVLKVLINAASSDGRRNTCLKFTRGSLKSQGLSWTLIQAQRDLVELRLRIARQVGSSREVLP